jgi:cytidyltransferase-like protein
MEYKIAIVSGGFDPLHSGHIQMIKEASEHGKVIVALNSDDWLTRKKGRSFINFEERSTILKSLRDVYKVISFTDDDDTARNALEIVREQYPESEIVFCNGGDRNINTTPEQKKADELNIKCLFGIGGDYKKQSSSTLLKNWIAGETTIRPWGSYTILEENPKRYKIKRITVNPTEKLSLQMHHHRSEHWVVVSGVAEIELDGKTTLLRIGESTFVQSGIKHRLKNPGMILLEVIEVQIGEYLEEDDIIRFEDDYNRGK